ncbi:MAG: hypothetical protein Phog2KO_45200 [Phototrophicaceae bacterium]
MAITQSNDPRTIKTREAFQQAFLDLLENKTYPHITVTDVAKQAGYARHTFYNHYETLDDLLSSVVDTILDGFFSEMGKWEIGKDRTQDDMVQIIASFFHAVKDNKNTILLLKHLDIDSLYIDRLTAYFTQYYYEHIRIELPSAGFSLAKYIISFNAYAFLAIVKPWLEDDMRHPPEVMAALLIQLTGGSAQRKKVIAQFKDLIKENIN